MQQETFNINLTGLKFKDLQSLNKFLRTSSTFLEPQPLENLLELGVLAHVGQLDVDTSAQAGAQVGRAGEDVAQVLIPHERMASLLKQALDLKHKQADDLIH